MVSILCCCFLYRLLFNRSLFLPPPKENIPLFKQSEIKQVADRLEQWSLSHRKQVYIVTIVLAAIAIVGAFRLQSNAYMVDDVPKTDKIYTDLKFFEKNFKGVMPLEILIDTKKKYGVTRNFNNLVKIDSFTQYLAAKPEIARPLSLIEGLKFAKQAFYDGDG